MAEILRMPEVAANALEAVLQDWPIPENTPFAAQATIATVETEKAVVDVDADAAGVILKTLVRPGSEVEVGAPIAILGEVGEEVGDLDALLAELGVASTTPSAAADRREIPEGFDSPTTTDPDAAAVGNGTASEHRVFASPLARKLAKDAGLTLDEITGTGPNGRIRRRDIEVALATVPSPETGEPRPMPEQPVQTSAASPGGVEDVQHSRMRQAIASRLTESQQTVPHFYVRGTARVDKLLKLRSQLIEGGQVKVSINDLVLKAVARTHTLVPAANVIWTAEAVRQFASVDIGVAIATERGLVTPVVRGVEQLTPTRVAEVVRDLVERARQGQLRQNELEGGSISVTNLGMYGTEEFAAIINPPQSAILAVGAARQEAVVKKGRLRVATVIHVTLSVDHRPIDGALAAEWMRTFVSVLESPIQILA